MSVALGVRNGVPKAKVGRDKLYEPECSSVLRYIAPVRKPKGKGKGHTGQGWCENRARAHDDTRIGALPAFRTLVHVGSYMRMAHYKPLLF